MRTAACPLALAIVLLLAPAPAAAQQPAPARSQVRIPPDGTDLFRALLDSKGIRPVSRDDVRRLNRFDDVIVIILGDQSQGWAGQDPFQIARMTIINGGGVLIAADTQTHINSAMRRFDGNQPVATIQAARVECDDKKACLHGESECPYVVPLDPDFVNLAPPAGTPLARIFDGDKDTGLKPLTRVATNRPSYIVVNGFASEFAYALAAYPPNCTAWDRRLPANAWFAIGGEGEWNNNFTRFQFLAMADHSVFINQMLVEPGTDNLELAYRTIEYLQGPRKRTRCLFIENGQVVESFDGLRREFEKQQGFPGLSPDKLIDIGNQFIAKLEQNNAHNTLLLGSDENPERQDRRAAAIVRGLMILGAIYAVWYLMRRSVGSRKPTDIPPPPNVAGVPAGPPGVFDRRQKELLRRNNVYEPARDIIREFFASVGVHGDQGPKLPRLVISDAVRKPESLKAAVRDFWKLAYGPPQELPVSRWREMEPYFERLREAHAEGKWHFVFAEGPVAAMA